MELNDFTIDYSICDSIDINLLKQYKILPIKIKELYILVATSEENQDKQPIITLLNSTIKFIYVDALELEYEYIHLNFKKTLNKLSQKAMNCLANDNQNQNYIDDIIDHLLFYCIKNDVSDIHFESLEKDMIIRVRIDGELTQYFRYNKKLYKLISTVIKIYGNLDISQVRMPLNASFTKKIDDQNYDFRISTMPTIYGESIVLRILDNDNIKRDLYEIGFRNSRYEAIKRSIMLSQGLILVTGPTGSGKTTTLYSMINALNSRQKKIITIEDPVEYKLDGIIQININEDIDLDYHTVLKNILRQDPDILMIGEIRDKKSLNIAMQAALTGHLVIATLHTNNAIETITRLKDLKAEPYLIASTLKMILSQRLLKVLCTKCKTDKTLDSFSKKVGCHFCNFSGYKGRIVVSEVLEIDNNISNMIANDKPINDIDQYLQKEKFSVIKDDAKRLIDQNITTLDEYYTKIDNNLF